jgi:CO/xanthine dehydrogenase Mo-binding subunit
MGQGVKNIAVQFAAEGLGIDVSLLNFDNSNSDTAAFSMDTAGSRSTVVVGNAALAAAKASLRSSRPLPAIPSACPPRLCPIPRAQHL